ncbi:MAG: sortase [Lachnospiraceae bacterium]|nr:sortase [Lachnospiraceae bacterium]
MKNKLPVVFAFFSLLLLIALIAVGLMSPGDKTEKSSRLFARSGTAYAAGSETKDGISDDLPDGMSDSMSAGTSAGTSDGMSAGMMTSGKNSENGAALASTETSDADEAGEIKTDTGNGAGGDTVSGAGTGKGTADTGAEETREPLEKYKDLLEINPYVAGWLKVDDSVIDDPVIYTPKSQNYFLHRDLAGNDTENGSLFLAVIWRDGYNNSLIYGHNMRDGSSFGSLKNFADEAYGKSHSVIHFDTLYEEREYELFAVFYSQIDEEELETEDDRAEADKRIEEDSVAKKEEAEGEPVEPKELTLKDMDLFEEFDDVDIYRTEKDEDNGRFRYYYYTDLSDRKDFDYYVENVKKNALYDTGVEAEWGDELLTMSTCSYHVTNGRLVVVAKRVR